MFRRRYDTQHNGTKQTLTPGINDTQHNQHPEQHSALKTSFIVLNFVVLLANFIGVIVPFYKKNLKNFFKKFPRIFSIENDAEGAPNPGRNRHRISQVEVYFYVSVSENKISILIKL